VLSALLASATLVGVGVVAGSAPAGAAGAATHFVVTPTSTTMGQGDEVTFTVTAETATNTVATGYTGTVAITSSDPGFVTVNSQTLTSGTQTYTSGLFTLGDQTITATDTVTPSITGTSPAIAVQRPPAIVERVTGSPLASLTTTGAQLSPAFAPSSALGDYALACGKMTGNAVTLTLTAPAGNTITVGSLSGNSVSFTVTLMENQAVDVQAPTPGDPTKSRTYWLRCLPPDFPKLTSTVSATPRPGWILTGGGFNAPATYSANYHYVMVLNSVGTPVWWRATGQFDGANLLNLQDNSLAWGWGFVAHNVIYNLDTGASSVLAGNAHELQQLPNGDFLTLQYQTMSGVNLTGIGGPASQSIQDCLIQEFTPQLQLVWSWSATAHMSVNESQNPVRTTSPFLPWDIYHCNSIDVDPSSPDPNNPNLLLSMRDTNAVYYIVNPEASSNAGDILWKLGGNAPAAGSPDANAVHYTFSGDPGFFAQHDARFGDKPNQITIFDDGSPAFTGQTACEHAARGAVFSLHPATATATLDRQYTVPGGQCAPFEGSYRRYAGGGDNLMDWGDVGGGNFVSEVNDRGQPILTITAPSASYRAIKVPVAALDDNQLHQDMGGVAPQVTGVTPTSGPLAGGTVVTITGHGFTQATGVSFGSVAATSFTVTSDESMTATAPAGGQRGFVPVQVTTMFGTSGKGKGFTYTP
jgi:hypothetical protein